jgi:hypothetical protein
MGTRRDALKQLFEGTVALVGGIALIGVGAFVFWLLYHWILLHN